MRQCSRTFTKKDMASTSTTTLLEAVNRVLLDVGERQVTSISNPASRKARAYLQDAFNDIQDFHDWAWTAQEFTASSWNDDEATFNNLKRVREVFHNNESNEPRSRIPYVPISTYEIYSIESYDSSTSPDTQPQHYTIIDEDTLKFNPYPTDVNGRSDIKVLGYRYYSFPELSNGVFDLPERFIPMLLKRATYMMLARHLGDLDAAQIHQQEFEIQLKHQRDKDFMYRSGGVNMHRRYRREN